MLLNIFFSSSSALYIKFGKTSLLAWSVFFASEPAMHILAMNSVRSSGLFPATKQKKSLFLGTDETIPAIPTSRFVFNPLLFRLFFVVGARLVQRI